MLRDEGTNQGGIRVLDCVGLGITCTRSGAVASVAVGNYYLPLSGGTMTGNLNILGNTAFATTRIKETNYSGSSILAIAPELVMETARGTLASPVSVADGDTLGRWSVYGMLGGSFLGPLADMIVSVDGTPGAEPPSRFTWATTTAAGATPERMRLDHNGFLGIGTTTLNNMLEVNGVINAATGYRIANAATSGNVLRGNGTNFISAQLNYSDLAGNAPVTSVFTRTGAVVAANNDYTWAQINKATSSIADITTKDHSLLSSLTTDDHTQYSLLAGRSGGQTLKGGTGSSDDLTLMSTANATKHRIYQGTSYYDEANNALNIVSTTGTPLNVSVDNTTFAANFTNYFFVGLGPNFNLRFSKGTLSNPTIVASGDIVGAFQFQGYNGSSFSAAAALIGEIDGTTSSTAMPGRLIFKTTPVSTTNPLERMRIDNAGHIYTKGTIPTVATNDCGSTTQGTITASSNDIAGSVTVGTLVVSSCAVTFGVAWATAPNCVITDDTNAVSPKAVATTTKLTISGTTITSDKITWICIGNS